jgi:5-formyltetrahydrofolate cyclo-ligase
MTATPSALAALKDTLRRAALARRDGLDAATREAAAEALAIDPAMPTFSAGTIVAGYFPIRSEIDPRPLMRRLSAAGARLALPVVMGDGESLVFRPWREGEALERASFGLSVPPASAGVVDPDVLLVPLAAFDRGGHRIGYGKGHYDRALARLDAGRRRLAIGLAFSTQRVDEVPAEPHDRPLDLILTEAGAIRPAILPAE